MELFYSPNSPYARKARIIIQELDLEPRVKQTAVALPADAKLRAINPLGKIPALLLDDGSVIYDSPVICEYFDTLHGGEKLFPEKFPERLVALRRQSLGDGMLDTMLMWRGEVLRPAANQSIKHMQAWRLKTNVSVDKLEEEAEALGSSRFSIGHIGIGVALGYIDFRFPELAWRDGHPRLTAWHETFAARPSVKATEPLDEP